MVHSRSSPNKNPVFVPSPRWLSESPARPGTLKHVDSTGEPTPSSQRSLDPSQQLRSPAPPPPANLYEGNAETFNVDPGIPFLATAGPTSDDGSIKEESPREKRFVGGFVTGIKKAVRNSLRDRTRSQQPEPPHPMYAQPSQFRDSGYAGSTPQFHPPPLPVVPQVDDNYRPSDDSPAQPPSDTFVHQPHQPEPYDETNIVARQEIFPPVVVRSPVDAELEFAPDFVGMDMGPTPTPSERSVKSYIKGASKLVHDISTLPWVEKGRVTADYYPEHSKRSDEPRRQPNITWVSQHYRPHHPTGPNSWALDSPIGVSSETSSPVEDLMAPRRRTSYEGIDLGDEFGEHYNRAEQPAYYPPHPEQFTQPPPNIRPLENGNAQPIPQEPSAWPDRGWHTPWLYPHDETWAGATSQVQHPPIGLWQTIGTNTNPRLPPFQPPQPRTPNQPTSHRTARSTSSRTRRQTLPSSMPPRLHLPPASDVRWQEYPLEMSGYVPYELAEHYYGDKYGPGVHAARPPLPGAPSQPLTSKASLRQQQPQGLFTNPIPVSSARVYS